VLVVDDDPVLQDLFQIFLKKIGFSRVVADLNGRNLSALYEIGPSLPFHAEDR
jgi:DNA-binding response OmpR family regulator